MGSARWDASDWSSYAATTKDKTRAEVFRARSLSPAFDPKGITMRESVDSDLNPASTPIIVALDVTGSMGDIPHKLIQGNLGTLMEEILARKPVSDPHLMFMGVGDAYYDRNPLQVTQFEADIRIAEQLREIYIEQGGGGNSFESYNLPWYFAAMKTKVDSVAKRGKKGYLFTIGDEEPPKELLASHVKAIIGDDLQADLSSADVLALAERYYHVFHIVVEQGSHCRGSGAAAVFSKWRDLLGQRVIPLADYEMLAEVIVSTMQANEGADRTTVAGSWTGDTSLVVAHALKGLTMDAGADSHGLVAL